MNKWYSYAIADAVGVFVYVVAVSWLLNSGTRWFARDPGLWAPIAMLMLFVLSAAVVGSLVFGRPILVFLDGRKREAVKIAIATIAIIAALTFLVFAGLVIFR